MKFYPLDSSRSLERDQFFGLGNFRLQSNPVIVKLYFYLIFSKIESQVKNYSVLVNGSITKKFDCLFLGPFSQIILQKSFFLTIFEISVNSPIFLTLFLTIFFLFLEKKVYLFHHFFKNFRKFFQKSPTPHLLFCIFFLHFCFFLHLFLKYYFMLFFCMFIFAI